MKLFLLPIQTGLNNYKDTVNCPIATALWNDGYYDVRASTTWWRGTKTKKFLFISYPVVYHGQIPFDIDDNAKRWAVNRVNQDIYFELPDPVNFNKSL